MGLFDNWFSGNKERNIPKIDDKKKDEHEKDILELENLEGYNIIESNYVINSIQEGLVVLKEQSSLIDEYRDMSLYYLVDDAIDEVSNAVVSCEEEEAPVELVTDKLDSKKSLVDILHEEHNHIVSLMKFNTKAYDYVRSWYTDGQLAIHPIVDDKKTKEGIKKIIFLDPRGVQKINNIKVDKLKPFDNKITEIEEFYIYDISKLKNGIKKTNSAIFTTQDILKISKNAMVVCTSGIQSADGTMVLSNLEKARKVLTDMKNMENAMIIERLTRAGNKRIFYVDTGTLPAKAAISYLQSVMNEYRNSVIDYDTKTGKIISGKKNMSISEDYFIPRREGSNSTEIDTLQGSDLTNQIDDILLVQKKLTKSLGVPGSRLNEESNIVIGGRGLEQSREEYKFNKFVQRLRRKFSTVFSDLLRLQLILKGICTEEEWENDILPNISYKFASDTFQKEQQELESFAQRLGILEQADAMLGKYFSKTTIERLVLSRSDDEIKEEEKRIEDEITSGKIPDPKEQPEEEA